MLANVPGGCGRGRRAGGDGPLARGPGALAQRRPGRPAVGGVQRLRDGQVLQRQPRSTLAVGFDGYVRTLSPALLEAWEQAGVCWVMTGSTQAGRALADPAAAPGAVAFYRALARRGELVFRASPMAGGRAPPSSTSIGRSITTRSDSGARDPSSRCIGCVRRGAPAALQAGPERDATLILKSAQ